MNENVKVCFRCQKRYIPVENLERGFCVGCTQADLVFEWLAFGKTYLPRPVFEGRDEEPDKGEA